MDVPLTISFCLLHILLQIPGDDHVHRNWSLSPSKLCSRSLQRYHKAVSISCCCYNKGWQSGGFKATEMYYLPVLESRAWNQGIHWVILSLKAWGEGLASSSFWWWQQSLAFLALQLTFLPLSSHGIPPHVSLSSSQSDCVRDHPTLVRLFIWTCYICNDPNSK